MMMIMMMMMMIIKMVMMKTKTSFFEFLVHTLLMKIDTPLNFSKDYTAAERNIKCGILKFWFQTLETTFFSIFKAPSCSPSRYVYQT